MSKWWTGVLWLLPTPRQFASLCLCVCLCLSIRLSGVLIRLLQHLCVSCQRLALKRLVKLEDISLTCVLGATAGKLLLPFCDITKMYPIAAEVARKSHTRSCLLLSLPSSPLLPTDQLAHTSSPPPPPHQQYSVFTMIINEMVLMLSFLPLFKIPSQWTEAGLLSSLYGSYLPDLTNVQKIHMPILQIVNTHYVMEHAKYSPLCLSIYLSIYLSI